jgi:hypothetical protein
MYDNRHLWKFQLLGIIAGVGLACAAELRLMAFSTESVEQTELPRMSPDDPPVIQTITTGKYFTGLPGAPMLGAILGWLAGGLFWAVKWYSSSE